MPPKLEPEGAFGELRRHAQQAGDDQPQRRAGPAHGNGHGYPGDVAYSHRARYRSRQSLELRDLTRVLVVVVAPADQPDGVGEAANVDEAQIHCEEKPPEDKPDHDQRDLGSENGHREEDESGHRVRKGPHGLVDGLINIHR
jgi:hypothetical protein